MMLKTKFLNFSNGLLLLGALAALCFVPANFAHSQEHAAVPTPKQRREPPVMRPPAVKAEPPAQSIQTDAPQLAPAGGVPQIKAPPGAADTTAAQAKPSPTPTPAEAVNEAGELDEDLAKDATTEINVKNADIAAIVRIFSKRAKRNYILDENVKGKVSIYLPGKVSSDESIRILDSVLALKGFTSVPIGENLWKIIPSKEAKQATIPTITSDKEGPASAAIVTRLINLKYVGADDIKQLIQPLVSNEGLINAYTGTNSLILIDSEDNIQRLAHLIQSLDVPFSDRELTIIPVKNAEAADIAKKLADILGQGQGDSGSKGDTGTNVDLIRARLREASSAVGQPPQMNRAITTAPLGGTGSASGATVGRSREPKIIPDERTNSIIVVADDDTTARIRALISQLDSEVDLSGYRFYVYHCQYASADDLAQVLSGLVGGGGGSASTRTSDSGLGSDMFGQGQTGFGQRGLGGSSSSRSGSSSSSRSQSRLSGQQRTPGQSRNQGNKKGVSSANIGDNISITADPSTNSLIINASKTDYMKIKELLQELDVKRRQVLVEAMLLEVGVEVGMSLGTDFLVSAGGKDGGLLAKSDFNNGLSGLFSDPTKISNFAAAAASAGTLTLPGNITIPTQSVLLQAAQSNSNVNILSAPNILATDNEPAEIVVGQNVPFIASKATSDTNLNNTFNQIDRQDVGITLRLTPKISSGDSVSLQIFTEVSAVVEATASSELGPSTTIRTSETSVVAKDGQMIVIGGLISDASNDSEAGVPFLKDIPVLGHLFRTSNEGKKRTNLLIFITPRIVQDQYDAREVTLARRDRLESDIYVENQYPDRSEILRSKDLDKVSQTSGMEVSKPGTIVGSRKDIKQSAPQEAARSEESDTIELKVVPKLPGESSAAQNPAFKKSETKTSAPLPNPAVEAVVESGDRYIVMETKVKGKEASHLPFKVAKKNGLFGVVMPSDGSAQAQQFFQVGESYRYEADGQGVEVKPLGIFHSESEAKEYYSSLKGEWYTLSPYEVMNIGKGPWVKGTKAAG